MTAKDNLLELWSLIDPKHITASKEIFDKNTDALLEFLITRILDKDRFEIGIFKDGRHRGSLLAYNEVYNQKEIELRLKKNLSYELVLILTNDNQEAIFQHKLSQDEIKLIPEQFTRLMYNIKELERPMTFYNTISD